MVSTATTKDKDMTRTISMRVRQSNLDMIEKAAEYSGKNRTEFFLDSALKVAEDLFLDRQHFSLNADQWSKIEEILDRPAPKNKKLKSLLNTKAPWG